MKTIQIIFKMTKWLKKEKCKHFVQRKVFLFTAYWDKKKKCNEKQLTNVERVKVEKLHTP